MCVTVGVLSEGKQEGDLFRTLYTRLDVLLTEIDGKIRDLKPVGYNMLHTRIWVCTYSDLQ